MRIVLFTGKGGVGKTSMAAATAVAASRSGRRTLVMSTDPAHSLSDAFDLPVGHDPVELERSLFAQQIDSQKRLEENWREIQDYAVEFLAWTGMTGIHAEELAVIPGLDEIFSLADIKRHHDSGDYDLLVVDCAPTAETVRLLSLPEAMAWYIEKLFPIERKIVRTVRPIFDRMRSLPPLAPDSVFSAVERFYGRLEGVREILVDPKITSVRLVVNPEKVVIAEARRTFTYLALFGYRVDAVIANRILPAEVDDSYFGAWKETQRIHMASIEESFGPIPVLRCRLFPREMIGPAALSEMAAETYGDLSPEAILHTEETLRITRNNGKLWLHVKVPFARQDEVDLHRGSEELLVKVGSFKRNITLPQSLRRAAIGGAHFEGDWLSIDIESNG